MPRSFIMIKWQFSIKYVPILICMGGSFFIPNSFATDPEQVGSEKALKRKPYNTRTDGRDSSDDKENIAPNTNLPIDVALRASKKVKINQDNKQSKIFRDLETICTQIHEGLQEGKANKISQSYASFEVCNYEENEWENLAKNLGISKWPSQATWKEAIGGKIFFPSQALEFEITPLYNYLLDRADYIKSFIIGAKFNHPISKYYLARALDRQNFHDKDDNAVPLIITNLYTEALNDLEKSSLTPDVCFILGRSHSSTQGALLNWHDRETAFEWHQKGKDFRNKYQLLKLKSKYRLVYSPPTSEEYLELARSGYPLAYLDAAELEKDTQIKLAILEEAVQKGYPSALLELGKTHGKSLQKDLRSSNNFSIEVFREYCHKAAEQGVASAYISLGGSYLGNVLNNSFEIEKKFKALSKEKLEKGIEAFEKAGQAHHPDGWYRLANVYKRLFDKACEDLKSKPSDEQALADKKNYNDKYYKCLVEGMALGNHSSYYDFCSHYHHLPEELLLLCDEISLAPQEDGFYRSIEDFLQRKD